MMILLLKAFDITLSILNVGDVVLDLILAKDNMLLLNGVD